METKLPREKVAVVKYDGTANALTDCPAKHY
jgi:hypothetical protein